MCLVENFVENPLLFYRYRQQPLHMFANKR